jgi:hypothetical protein
MQQHKLVVLLPHAKFTDSFCQGVVIRVKVKWLRADLTAFTMSQKILILPTVIMCILIKSLDAASYDTAVMILSNAEIVTCRTHPAVSPSVTVHQQLNRLLNYHEVRYGSSLPKALKQPSIL